MMKMVSELPLKATVEVVSVCVSRRVVGEVHLLTSVRSDDYCDVMWYDRRGVNSAFGLALFYENKWVVFCVSVFPQ